MIKADPHARPVDTKPQRPAAPPLARALAKVTRRLARTSGKAAPVVVKDWEAIVGPDLAGHCRPASLRGGGARRVLTVEAYSGPAAARLQFMSDILLSRVKERLGAGAPTHLKVRLGNRPLVEDETAPAAPSRPAPRALEDGGLDAALARLGEACAKRPG